MKSTFASRAKVTEKLSTSSIRAPNSSILHQQNRITANIYSKQIKSKNCSTLTNNLRSNNTLSNAEGQLLSINNTIQSSHHSSSFVPVTNHVANHSNNIHSNKSLYNSKLKINLSNLKNNLHTPIPLSTNNSANKLSNLSHNYNKNNNFDSKSLNLVNHSSKIENLRPGNSIINSVKVGSTTSLASSGKRKAISTSNASNSASAKSSLIIMPLQKEIERLKRKIETINSQLNKKEECLKRNQLAIKSLSIIINHLNINFDAFSNPKLKQQIQNLKANEYNLEQIIKNKDIEINSINDEKVSKVLELSEEIRQLKLELDNKRLRHQNEKEKLLEMFECEMKSAEKIHLSDLRNEQNKRQAIDNELNKFKEVFDQKVAENNTLKRKLEELENNFHLDKEKKVRLLSEKIKFLNSEVSSLKTVLELKEDEIRNLNLKIRTEISAKEDLETLKHTTANLNQVNEQLEISLKIKTESMNKLQYELEEIKSMYNNENKERLNLTRKNEELQFFLNESLNGSLYSTPLPIKVKNNELKQHLNNEFNNDNSCLPQNKYYTCSKITSLNDNNNNTNRPVFYTPSENNFINDNFDKFKSLNRFKSTFDEGKNLRLNKKKKCLKEDFDKFKLSEIQNNNQLDVINNHDNKDYNFNINSCFSSNCTLNQVQNSYNDHKDSEIKNDIEFTNNISQKLLKINIKPNIDNEFLKEDKDSSKDEFVFNLNKSKLKIDCNDNHNIKSNQIITDCNSSFEDTSYNSLKAIDFNNYNGLLGEVQARTIISDEIVFELAKDDNHHDSNQNGNHLNQNLKFHKLSQSILDSGFGDI